jgi:predicted site-specific integrase-resolvase
MDKCAGCSSHADRSTGRAPLPDWPRLMDLRTAAAYLSIGSRTLEDWIHDGILEKVPMPGSTLKNKNGNVIVHAKNRAIVKILIDKADLDRLIDERRADV